ncbi:hypothetical protein QE436_000296 [Pantoea anthophila]|nr:hypothetical protein [Pantoea anthophila]
MLRRESEEFFTIRRAIYLPAPVRRPVTFAQNQTSRQICTGAGLISPAVTEGFSYRWCSALERIKIITECFSRT